MRAFFPIFCAILTGALSTACTSAFAQAKIAAPEVSTSTWPSIRALADPDDDDKSPVPPELSSVLKPSIDLNQWEIPRAPPALACPSGSREKKNVTDSGWEVACVRGDEEERDGPYQAVDRKALVFKQSVYDAGELDGQHIEISLRPDILVSSQPGSSNESTSVRFVERAKALIAAGWPFAKAANPVCDEGTRLILSAGRAACELPDGTFHGDRVIEYPGYLAFQQMSLGYPKSSVGVDDQRKARESVYEHGRLSRVLEYERGKVLVLSVYDGDDVALLQRIGERTVVSRVRKGKKHGLQERWAADGTLEYRQMYQDGEEHGDGATWQGGKLATVFHVENGERVEETRTEGSVHRCKTDAGRNGVCERVEKGSVVYREVRRAGKIAAWVQFYGDGVKAAEGWTSADELSSERRDFLADGKPRWEEICDEKQCTSTVWDASGQKTVTVNPRSPPSSEAATLVGPLNALRPLLGGARAKPNTQVAVP